MDTPELSPETIARIREATKPKRRRVRKDDKEDIREAALAELEPIAIERLREQLDHNDPRVVQAAAKIILEHKWGRATPRAQASTQTQHTKVVYETAAAPGGLNGDEG